MYVECNKYVYQNIEDYPFIIRFKTRYATTCIKQYSFNIEDYPFIIRFKTYSMSFLKEYSTNSHNIEDYPFIIRFKTVVGTDENGQLDTVY